MALCSSIFRSYDIRGITGTQLTAELAHDLGAAIGTRLAATTRQSVVVGRDNRHSGVWLERALVEGLESTGCRVARLGMVPTPLVYWASTIMEADAAIQVTGSHNPVEYNGFKISIAGKTLRAMDLAALKDEIEAGDFIAAVGSSMNWRLHHRYLVDLAQRIDRTTEKLTVVVDAGNGAAGPTAVALLRLLGHTVIPLHCTPDGRFPNHHPDPTVDENLQDLIWSVRANAADLGIAFDADGDRLGAVTSAGEIVRGDQLLTLFASDVLQHRPRATIIGEVKCSRVFFDQVRDMGGEALLCRTGHAPIKRMMRSTGALLAGEMSGHFFFADRYFGFDDALYAAARLLELIGRSGRTLAHLTHALPKTFATAEKRIPCPDDEKWAVMESLRSAFHALYARAECESLVEVDGVRVEWPAGWGLVRASNTEPVLVLRFEATSPHELLRIQAVFGHELRKHIELNSPDEVLLEGAA